MVARYRRARVTNVIASEWLRRYDAIPSKVENGVLVKVTSSLDDFEAVQYTAKTRQLRLIVQAGNGSFAVFKDGDFRGWRTSMLEAVVLAKWSRADAVRGLS